MLAAMSLSAAGPGSAGQVAVVGTGDGMEILQEIASSFRSQFEGMDVVVPPSIGSGGAIAAVGSGRAILGRVARPLKENERASGVEYHPVLAIPAAFYVHPGVRRRNFTTRELRRIFSGEVTNWREVGGDDLRIRIVRREDADSTLLVLRAALPEFRDIVFTERSKLAMTTQEAFESIRGNPGAIGFGPYSTEMTRRLGVIEVDGRTPTHPDYPAHVELALIYRPESVNQDIRRFIDYFATQQVRQIIRDFGAKPIAQ